MDSPHFFPFLDVSPIAFTTHEPPDHGSVFRLSSCEGGRQLRTRRLVDRIRSGSVQNVRFGDLVELLEELGFRLDRVRGSHRVYLHSAVPRPLPLQADRGKAKPYQIRQLLRILEEYNLQGEIDR